MSATTLAAAPLPARSGSVNAPAALGAGADTVSEGEIRKALAAGFPASKIVAIDMGRGVAVLQTPEMVRTWPACRP